MASNLRLFSAPLRQGFGGQAPGWRFGALMILPTSLSPIIHKLSAAGPGSSALTALPTLGLLDRVHDYDCGPSGVNETLSERRFRPFASKTRELSGLEPNRVSCTSGIGAAEQVSCGRISPDPLDAPERVASARLDDVSPALECIQRSFGESGFQANRDRGTLLVEVRVGHQSQPRSLDGLLNGHSEVEYVDQDLELGLPDGLATWSAQGKHKLTVLHDDDWRVVENRNLSRTDIIHIVRVG